MEIPIHVKLEIKSYIIRKDRSKASIEFQSKQRYDSETNTLECSIAMHEHKIHGFYIDESLQTDVKKGLMDLIYGDCQVNHNFDDIALLLYPEAKIMNYINNITNKIINYNGFVSQNVNIANLFKDIYTNSHFYLVLEVLNDRLEDLNKNEQIELKKYIKHYIYLAIINWANAIFKWKDWYLDNYQKEFTQKVYNQVFKSVFQEETI